MFNINRYDRILPNHAIHVEIQIFLKESFCEQRCFTLDLSLHGIKNFRFRLHLFV